MKHCATCQRLFPGSFEACPTDHAPLRTVRDLEPGMIIRGKYVVQEWLGTGGMAAVYRAQHKLLNEMRAVKVVASKFATHEDLLKRFRQEAAITRRLRHENAVWVEDLDELEDGRPFIAMEFLQGSDLRRLIRSQGPLGVDRSLKLGEQVASALSAAHKLGIIHRDIKPDNILVTRDATGKEKAKVLDFGIAKIKEGVLQNEHTATKTGVIIGTLDYMSPEQVEGQIGDKLDGRSDIYSMGIVLYEMLTARVPFESETPMGMCLHHLQTVPRPPHELRPDLHIPESVSAILMKALEKRRERRFQSADEMLVALRNHGLSNNTAAFAATRISAPQPATGANAGPKSTRNPSAAAVTAAKAEADPTPPRVEVLKSAVDRYTPAADRGKRRRILLVAITVILCVTAGYLLVNALERRNAEMRTHEALIRSRILEKLQSSPVLQGRGKDIAVSVKEDFVTLSGSVSLPGDKDEAANEAQDLPGVSRVVNNLVVVGMPVAQTEPSRADAAKNASNVATEVLGSISRPARRSPGGSAAVSPANAQKASELVQAAQTEMDRANYSAAISNFQEAMRLDPKSAAARNGLKQALSAQKTEQEMGTR